LGITSEVVKITGDCIYVQREMKERKREEWGSKETDGCPLTSPLLQRHSIMMCKDLQ
jgi:hypothetical protein